MLKRARMCACALKIKGPNEIIIFYLMKGGHALRQPDHSELRRARMRACVCGMLRFIKNRRTKTKTNARDYFKNPKNYSNHAEIY